MIYTARAPVQVEDRLYFYYGGWDGPHNSAKAKAAIGLAVLRLDGFCSMQAGGEEGSLVSRRETLDRPRITINARTRADGLIAAEILNAQGEVLEGFGRNDCHVFRGDSVRHVLTWNTARFSPAQQEGEKKIRFYLRNADLFSYAP